MDDIVYRKFEPKDQDDVANLYLSGMNAHLNVIPIYGESYAWFVDDKLKPEGDMRNIQSVFMSGEKKSCFFVADRGGEIVGIVGCMPCTKYTDDYCEIVRMFVSANCRKLNIGKNLVAMLEAWAKEQGYAYIYLSMQPIRASK